MFQSCLWHIIYTRNLSNVYNFAEEALVTSCRHLRKHLTHDKQGALLNVIKIKQALSTFKHRTIDIKGDLKKKRGLSIDPDRSAALWNITINTVTISVTILNFICIQLYLSEFSAVLVARFNDLAASRLLPCKSSISLWAIDNSF